MQLQVTKRLSHGFTNQFSYVWSRNLGENDSDGTLNYLNGRNRSLNKSLVGFHRTHDFRSNGTFELPFGPGRPLLNNAPGWMSRLVERWQLGGIFSLSSGAPLSITSGVSSWNQFTVTGGAGTNNTPVVVGDFPKSLGSISKEATGVINYFAGLKQVTDPARNDVTPLQTLQGSFSNFAIADSADKLLLVNAAPGQLGTLGQKWSEGPKNIGLDINLVKRIKLAESKEFELRVDAINVLNHPLFANPNLNIDNANFGRITANATNPGNRTFVMNARLSF
jgi:hypothetical protein